MTVVLEWPQITLLVLFFVEALFQAAKHGEPRDNYCIGSWLFGFLILFSLLIAGGFFW